MMQVNTSNAVERQWALWQMRQTLQSNSVVDVKQVTLAKEVIPSSLAMDKEGSD